MEAAGKKCGGELSATDILKTGGGRGKRGTPRKFFDTQKKKQEVANGPDPGGGKPKRHAQGKLLILAHPGVLGGVSLSQKGSSQLLWTGIKKFQTQNRWP